MQRNALSLNASDSLIWSIMMETSVVGELDFLLYSVSTSMSRVCYTNPASTVSLTIIGAAAVQQVTYKQGDIIILYPLDLPHYPSIYTRHIPPNIAIMPARYSVMFYPHITQIDII
jgi:hypothetical protein